MSTVKVVIIIVKAAILIVDDVIPVVSSIYKRVKEACEDVKSERAKKSL